MRGDGKNNRGERRAGKSRGERTTRGERRGPERRQRPRLLDAGIGLGRLLQRGRRSGAESGAGERTILGLSTGRAIILAVVVCALALTLAVPLRTYFAQRSEAAELSAQRVELEQDLNQLRDQRAQQQDPAFIRAEARERLRLVMPGETPFQVQLPGAYEAEQARRVGPAPKGGPWYTDLWRTISQPHPAAQVPVAPAPVAPAPKPAG